MRKLLLGLLVSLMSVSLSGNVCAKPNFGTNCAACHGAPSVTSFDLPPSHSSLDVPINDFTAADTDGAKSNLAGVTGYLLTTTSTTPDAGDPAWQSSPPTSYTFASDGLQTLYAWAKDSLGNISAAISDAVDILIVTNIPPVADAGPDQTVDEGIVVTLDGSNSDDSDDGIVSYLWEQIGGPVGVVISNPTSEQPTFETPNVGPAGVALTFRLTVADASGATAADTMIVNVSWVNIQPVADAGADQTVAEGESVTLNGSASNGVDDAIATYSWAQMDNTGVMAVLSDPHAPNPQFTITDVGPNGESLTFELTVADEGGLQATDRCIVNVTNINRTPVADAGAAQTVDAGSEVALDASGSYDPDGDLNAETAFTWKQTAGTAVTLSSPGAVNPVFTAPSVAEGSSETLMFELTVTDNAMLQAADSCEVVVNGTTPPPVEPPPVEEPLAEPPPPVEPPPVEEPPPVVDTPSVERMREYKHLAKENLRMSRSFAKKSLSFKRLYRIYRHKNPSLAQDYLAQANDFKAQSLDAKWRARNYLKLYKQAKADLGGGHHWRQHEDDGDDRDRD